MIGVVMLQREAQGELLLKGMRQMPNYKIQQYDKLTGLPFYEDFLALAEEAKEKKQLSDDEQFVVIAMDISNFKFINQIYGYEIGNQLLQSLVNITVIDNYKKDIHN